MVVLVGLAPTKRSILSRVAVLFALTSQNYKKGGQRNGTYTHITSLKSSALSTPVFS
jgi:hypothetical protein